jgi:chemotaxis family two-component system sensor histidine kinase/response regulator PixL
MALSPDIRDQAYQFFIEEAPELLQVIEAGLLTLSSDRSTALVHNLMRCAHSIKGGAASVELEAIATLAHRLENIFKALYSETLEIDTDTESQLLQAYDCLRLPLTQQIIAGYFDTEQALAVADPIFIQLEERFEDALSQADTYIPSSADLGVDMTKSIFEVDVQEGLEHLEKVVAHPSNYEVAGELRAQAEVFAGFAELLNQLEFGAIAATTLRALEVHPERALEITQLALSDFKVARQVVLAGNAFGASVSGDAEFTHTQEIKPSAALVALANSTPTNALDISPAFLDELLAAEVPEDTHFSAQERQLEDIFTISHEFLDELPAAEVPEDTHFSAQERQLEDIFTISHEFLDELPAAEVLEDTQLSAQERQLEDIFTISHEFLNELPAAEVPEDTQLSAQEQQLEQIFGIFDEFLDELPAAAEVSKDTQIANEDWELEETLTISPEYGVESTDIASEVDADTDVPDFPGIIDVEWVGEATSVSEVAAGETASVEEAFKSADAIPETEASAGSSLVPVTFTSNSLQELHSDVVEPKDAPETLEEAVQSIEQIFESLPPLQGIPTPTAQSNSPPEVEEKQAENIRSEMSKKISSPASSSAGASSALSVRVDSERLEQINNLVGELAINRNGLSLQNEQLQGSVRELLNRFVRVQNMVGELRKLSDQMLVAPQRHKDETLPPSVSHLGDLSVRADFDSLELDSYGVLYSRLQVLLEDMVQLEESVDDIVLFARATDQTLGQQRQMLIHLRDQLMWARMLPLGEVLNRFPRILRDLSTSYHKSVNLKLSGTGVLVDKAVLEKLFDPLLHLLRNAFDHGIELPQTRRDQGKPEQGQIEIRAYHQGSQTVIEVRDDGQGLNTERIRSRGLELGLLSRSQLATISNNRLFELIFEPGFSTASEVSELSGRGVGLDVVRSQMRSLKGTISVTSSPGVGTTFTLRLPLTLTIAKLLVSFIGPTAVAIPSDSIEEIVIPKANQIKQSAAQRFLHWRGQIVPVYRLADLLDYACPLPETSASKALIAVPSPKDWALPILLLRQGQQFLALEIERLVTEQELVIKPFGSAIAPPSCTYGCTILGDGSLIPVLDAAVLLDQVLKQGTSVTATTTSSNLQPAIGIGSPSASAGSENSSITKAALKMAKAPTVLVVDDAVALRRTLALTLERAGCRVLQARDGREAIEQLQQSSSVDLVICDIEMPNMNGFEFLGQRRQDPQLLKIPVVMLTSRSNDKHRWLAMQLGANAYFTKPYLEQEFVGAIKHIISESTPESMPALQPIH